MADDIFLILHGWGGNKPAHWQEHLYNALTDAGKKVHYPKMPTPPRRSRKRGWQRSRKRSTRSGPASNLR